MIDSTPWGFTRSLYQMLIGIMDKQKVVIFTAASPTKEEIDLFLEKGAHSILKKPIDPDDLSKFVYKLESER